MVNSTADVIRELARLVLARAEDASDHVLRVAVTGITASGKSTIAAELVDHIRASGLPCVRLPVDGFHNPQSVRYQRGRDSPEGYYRDAYNYESLIKDVLLPLGPGGNGRYVERAFDLDSDTPINLKPTHAPVGSVVILDASFLLRPEIRDFFDFRIFVHAAFEIAEVRGVQRDADSLGGPAEATRLYRTRYHEAQRIYLREAQPLNHADALVINDNLDAPILFTRAPARASS